MTEEDKRYDFLCRSPQGTFYWDRGTKRVVMEDHDHNLVSADRYVVTRGNDGIWRSRIKPPPRLDLATLKEGLS